MGNGRHHLEGFEGRLVTAESEACVFTTFRRGIALPSEETVGKYRKTIVAVVGAGVVIAGRLLGADSDAYFIIVTLATALGVYATPNS